MARKDLIRTLFILNSNHFFLSLNVSVILHINVTETFIDAMKFQIETAMTQSTVFMQPFFT